MLIGICDDEPAVFGDIRKILDEYMEKAGMEYQLFTFDSANRVKEFFRKRTLDLLLLDIEMPQQSGIELAGEIAAVHPDCQIAYCTNYLEFATDVYETRHCYYILKQEFSKRLPFVIDKVLEARQHMQESICIPVHGGRELVVKNQIVYIERQGKKTLLYLEDKTVRETGMKLDEMMKLLDSSEFVRCHNSYIVSFSRVKRYSRQELVLSNGKPVAVSRSYIEPVREAFARWNWENL